MSAANHEKVVRLKVEGRVQRTGFRAWAQREAEARGLDGWVRDRTEGWVEILLAGPAGQVDDMAALCHAGPKAARVETVTEQAVDPDAPIWVGFHHLPAK